MSRGACVLTINAYGHQGRVIDGCFFKGVIQIVCRGMPETHFDDGLLDTICMGFKGRKVKEIIPLVVS